MNYGQQLEEIRAIGLAEDEERQRGLSLWFETEKHRKRLMTAAVPKLQCTATKPNGERCGKTARCDYFGQKCSAHAPHIEDYPSLEAVRARWPDHEHNLQSDA